MTIYPRARFASNLKQKACTTKIRVAGGVRSKPAEETPSSRCRDRGWVNVLSFGHGAVIGPATHVFDHGEGRADAAGIGSISFPEVV
jgi:hypothetical protein